MEMERKEDNAKMENGFFWFKKFATLFLVSCICIINASKGEGTLFAIIGGSNAN